MSWLTPNACAKAESSYDPRAKLEAVFRDLDAWSETMLSVALEAWNEVDPFHCYYGEDCNPDEYLGYAQKFVEGMRRELPAMDVSPQQTSPFLVEELVRRSFHVSQTCYNPAIGSCWVTRRNRRRIARTISNRLEAIGFTLPVPNHPKGR